MLIRNINRYCKDEKNHIFIGKIKDFRGLPTRKDPTKILMLITIEDETIP